MSEVSIRRLGAADWELLRDIRLAALQDAPDAFASSFERERDWSPAQWRSRVADVAWYVATVAEEPAGIAAGMAYEGLVTRRNLISMWVDPVHRGLGIAAALLAVVREWAIADGARELSLWVTDGNAAAASAYRRAGFVPTGRRQPLPSNRSISEEEWLLTLRS